MIKYIKKYWWAAVLAPLFMIGEASMDLLQPRLMSKIVDEGVLGLSNNGVGDLGLVIRLGLMMIFFVFIGGVCGIMSGIFANIAGQNFGNDVRKDLFSRIMSFSFSQTDEFSTGSLITRVTNDVTQVQNFVQMALRGFVRTFILFIGGLFCMLSLNLSFGVVIGISLPLILLCVIYFIAKANPKFTILQKKLDNLNNVMQENVAGSRVVKAYVREDYEKKRFGKSNDELVNTQLDVLLLLSYMTPIMNVILNFSVVAIIKVGQINVMNGSVTPGEVMAAITYASQVLNAVMRMNMIFQNASRGMTSGKRILEVLNCLPEIKDGDFEGFKGDDGSARDEERDKKPGDIIFENVSFAYPTQKEDLIIKDFSLHIRPGETIGILGETGCGKSSLVNLIPRFYDVSSGRVLIDGVDVRDYKLKALRDKIAIALQKSEIFSETIRENIYWGKKDADYDRVMHAAKMAQALEFIENKPEGIGTVVTQGGTSLSGGQKQRLAIARAVIKGADILIFDDASSALDLKTEANLYKDLKEEYPNTTKIIVAQRIASVKDADRIVIIDEGKLSAVGSHEELLKISPIYQDIYNSQLGGGQIAE
ncbi:ABC transporter ATP-binding protein [Lachnospira multipara]|uniref:ABC transporter ATP-binding protein n=1 Tax=Lachnospira multipara TaxID=28051 RepID=UPI00040F56B7|nr:ABC transporter ATP-binding protein [Lachnospira multipara]